MRLLRSYCWQMIIVVVFFSTPLPCLADKAALLHQTAGFSYDPIAKREIGIQYALNYSFEESDVLYGYYLGRIEKTTFHNSFKGYYGITDRVSAYVDLPILFIEYKGKNETLTNDDIGDLSFGIKYQLAVPGENLPSINFDVGCRLPTGSDPFDLDQNKAYVATGEGNISINSALNMSIQPVDWLLMYGSIRFEYHFDRTGLRTSVGTQGEAGIYMEEVDFGHALGGNAGVAAAVSETITLFTAYSYRRQGAPSYVYVGQPGIKGKEDTSSILRFGAGFLVKDSLGIYPSISRDFDNENGRIEINFRLDFGWQL